MPAVEVMGNSVFQGCVKLATDVPPQLKEIGSSCFAGCLATTSVTVPATLTKLSLACFAGSGLMTITLPEVMSEIGVRALADTNLTALELPQKLVTLGYGALSGVHLKRLVVGDSIVNWTGGLTGLSGVTELVLRGPADCRNWPPQLAGVLAPGFSVTIDTPKGSLSPLGDFTDDTLTISEGHVQWFGILAHREAISTLVLGADVTCEADVFRALPSLTIVVMPKSKITELPSFEGCPLLAEVGLPMLLEVIGDGVFRMCPQLKSVVMGDRVHTIGAERQ
jgi:hypothetical protein